MKRVVVTGNGKSGSWKIRGAQLGAAIGAEVTPHAVSLSRADLLVIVKRVDPRSLTAARTAKLKIVWDVVDAWPQPHGNLWARVTCLEWLERTIKTVKPYAIIAATQTMTHDIAEIGFKGPVLALPHHARPGQTINPIRREVKTVGYEGGVAYLGKWQHILETECWRRNWKFVLNPSQLADLDIVVALREADGYAAKNWKSNVKLANAQGSGTPIICNSEEGYLETTSGAEEWAGSPQHLSKALDCLTLHAIRENVSTIMQSCAPTLASMASSYRTWLESL